MVFQPDSFQELVSSSKKRNHRLSMKNFCGSPPSAMMAWLTRPVVPMMFMNSAPTTTQLRKWGRYMTVCRPRRITLLRTSLIITARMMPTGKQNITLSALITKVLVTAWRNLLCRHSAVQLSSPTQGLCEMASKGLAPANMLYFLNPMTRPYIGV